MTDKDADPAIPTGGLLPGEGAQSETPDAWRIEIANDYGSRTYTVTDDNGQQRYAHEDQLPLWVVLALGLTFVGAQLDAFAGVEAREPVAFGSGERGRQPE